MTTDLNMVDNWTGYILLGFFIPMIFFFLRYLLMVGVAVGFIRLFQRRLQAYKIQQKDRPKNQAKVEFLNSLRTFVVFGLVSLADFWAIQAGHTQIYDKVSQQGWLYFWLSIGIMVLIHDSYFYWSHRLMHIEPIYRTIHHTHHRSKDPTPWASFSFSTVEAFLEALIGPVLFFVMPVHPLAFLIFLFYMTAINILGHLSYEIFPRWFAWVLPFSWSNTPTAHNMHHRYQNHNFGLYFLFWDKWMGTLHPDYYQLFYQLRPQKEGRKTSP